MPISKAQYKAQQKYDKNNTKMFLMKLHIRNDADIFNWLDKQDSKQGAVKELIRKQINKENKKK